jgi:hypothetical protein
MEMQVEGRVLVGLLHMHLGRQVRQWLWLT